MSAGIAQSQAASPSVHLLLFIGWWDYTWHGQSSQLKMWVFSSWSIRICRHHFCPACLCFHSVSCAAPQLPPSSCCRPSSLQPSDHSRLLLAPSVPGAMPAPPGLLPHASPAYAGPFLALLLTTVLQRRALLQVSCPRGLLYPLSPRQQSHCLRQSTWRLIFQDATKGHFLFSSWKPPGDFTPPLPSNSPIW